MNYYKPGRSRIKAIFCKTKKRFSKIFDVDGATWKKDIKPDISNSMNLNLLSKLINPPKFAQIISV